MPDQWLFSYGTLQLPQVQQATFGRLMEGFADQLPSFTLTMLEITDPQVIATSGQTHHPIIALTGNPADQVNGMALLVSKPELHQADSYEVVNYKRQLVTLASGRPGFIWRLKIGKPNRPLLGALRQPIA
ncbi:gamma-glutamylcyclotransferase family protein [Paludibacterium denitrificans]|uniref:Gamma-glutamylcyclotransferase n=1 Tax=Paludibacterium denitrificans TaxID=2675226 RepID=A0A844GAF1_9NEIS|nr:gamma-glutamylcyclotransferase family protein [Paludibacterium denitrificans]MTD33426.1 gamma-glutamylcyclotransferase [Paludibacterium denitrificans]